MKRNVTLKKLMTHIWETNSVHTQKMADHLEKYIKASDFMKALIEARKSKKITIN